MSLLVPDRVLIEEILDEGGGAEYDVVGNLADIRLINRLIGGGRILTKALAEFVSGGPLESDRSISVLDVGSGSADIPDCISQWFRSLGWSSEVVAVDLIPRHLVLARQLGVGADVKLVSADAAKLPFADRSFDFVTATHLIHHFGEDEVVGVLAELARVARSAVIVVDPIRNRLSYYLVRLVSLLLARSYITRHDGPVSILRSFTGSELQSLASRVGFRSFRIDSVFPYRVLLVGIPAC
jgi:ubiquinone/menaquinone biosynthesis C-methylase UbiE